MILLCYPFHCSKTLVAKHNDSDHWKSEANGEKKKIVTKVIRGCPGGATAGKRDYKVNSIVGMMGWGLWLGSWPTALNFQILGRSMCNNTILV